MFSAWTENKKQDDRGKLRWTDSKGLDTCHDPTRIPVCRGEARGEARSGPSSLALGDDYRQIPGLGLAAKGSGLVRRHGCITREGARLSASRKESRQGKLGARGSSETLPGQLQLRPGKAAPGYKTEREVREGCGMESRSRF